MDYKWVISVFVWSQLAMTALWILILLVVISAISGCAHNPCIDNPRNMQCMTAEELEEALG